MDRAYDHRSWHGTNLRGSIRGLSTRRASWRPGPARHNIWEIVVHAAYWKYVAWRRLANAGRGSFPLTGSNWFHRPVAATNAAWQADVSLLDAMHKKLRERVKGLSDRELRRTPSGSTVSNFDLLAGVAAHDLYHAGQIQLLKKLSARRSR
jgi:hypothetical protein